MSSITNTMATVLVAAAFLGCLAFVLLYGLLARWWQSDVGRNAMTFAGCETVVLGLSLAFRLFGDYRGRETALLVAFGALVVAVWWRVGAVVRAQLSRRRRQDSQI